jgi:hypothetical protein
MSCGEKGGFGRLFLWPHEKIERGSFGARQIAFSPHQCVKLLASGDVDETLLAAIAAN